MGAVLPELDTFRGHAPARPARRARHGLPRESRLHRGESRLERGAAVQGTRLVAGPGAELAVAAARREIGVGEAVRDRGDRPLATDLPAPPPPEKRKHDLRGTDRKLNVLGRGVSVRADIGGDRTL